MKCILHIGTPKTGTTSLQEFLHINRDLLARHGYLYTKSAGLRNNRSLAVAAFNLDRRDDFTRTHGLRNGNALKRYQAATTESLRRELKKARDLETVLFSSEHIHSRLGTDQEISRLKNILNGLGLEQIAILVYLRAPAELVNSLHSTAVKCGSTRAVPPGPDSPHSRLLCDHRNTLMRYRDVFGIDSVVPRIYSKTDLVNGSIIEDFAEAIGLQLSRMGCVMPKRENESVTVLGVELLRRINSELAVLGPRQRVNSLRGNIASYILEHCKDGDRYLMPLEVRRQYEQAFRESNEWVRSEYFPDRKALFEESRPSCASEPGLKESDLDQIAQLVSAIWIDRARPSNEIGKILKVARSILKRGWAGRSSWNKMLG